MLHLRLVQLLEQGEWAAYFVIIGVGHFERRIRARSLINCGRKNLPLKRFNIDKSFCSNSFEGCDRFQPSFSFVHKMFTKLPSILLFM